jgi:hypothetical protein
MMQKLENEIPVILCKMEKNFPPGFFNPMQYLLIHLPYEAKVDGPVQYRWMYHIERALIYLKLLVDNRSRVEGSITEAFILKEVAYFSSVYFTEEHNRIDINGFLFRSTAFEALRPLVATTNSRVVMREIDVQGCKTNYYGIINKILEFSFIRNK